MKTPINDIIKKHKEHISFHTPAHSGVIDSSGKIGNLPIYLDITELSYSDNLLSPQGVIKKSQEIASKIYEVDGTIYITTGATTAIQVAINALRDKKFLAVGNIHKAVFNAFRLFEVESYYGRDRVKIREYLKETNPDVLVITSPDYFGNSENLKEISALCKEKNITLLIDASHGSHFQLSHKLPVSATKYGDIVIHSLHKTLPVLTGGALLHYKKGYKDYLYSSLNQIHSTSPSYLILSSIEKGIVDFHHQGKDFYHNVLERIADFQKNLPLPFTIESGDDKSRLVIASPYQNLQEELERQGIYPEMSYENKVVFIVTPYNYHQLDKLILALKGVKGLPYKGSKIPLPQMDSAVKLSFPKRFELVELSLAIGRVSYSEVGFYPPGTPVVLSGQLLSASIIDFLKLNSSRLFGLDKGRVAVVI